MQLSPDPFSTSDDCRCSPRRNDCCGTRDAGGRVDGAHTAPSVELLPLEAPTSSGNPGNNSAHQNDAIGDDDSGGHAAAVPPPQLPRLGHHCHSGGRLLSLLQFEASGSKGASAAATGAGDGFSLGPAAPVDSQSVMQFGTSVTNGGPPSGTSPNSLGQYKRENLRGGGRRACQWASPQVDSP